MKAFQEIGWQKALSYVWLTLVLLIYRLTLLSPIRVAFLRLVGARIGRNVVVHDLHFFNSYRKGFRAVQVGRPESFHKPAPARLTRELPACAKATGGRRENRTR